MKYMGSKNRIAKYIVPILQNDLDKNGYDGYLEPFVGGANLIDKVVHENRIGLDNQRYLIEFLKYVRDVNEYPKEIDKREYDKVRNFYNTGLGYYEDWYVGLVGFLASYNGRFFDGGYAKAITTKSGKVRNYYNESVRNVSKQSPNLYDIKFYEYDFFYLDVEGFLIYCDPPYKGTKQYGIGIGFSHDDFWEKVRYLSEKNTVYVSEEYAPNDFEVVWEQDIVRSIDNRKRKKATEKLFKIKDKANDK